MSINQRRKITYKYIASNQPSNFLMRFRMSNLNQIIDFTKLFQDVELSAAIQQLKQNPAQLQQFLQGQQDTVYKDIIKQKESTFQKVYGDLGRASQAQEAILMYDKRSKELSDMQQNIYENQKNSADAVISDKNLAGRKYEMNEWSVNNKNDTLFVFSMIFIVLTCLVLITVVWRMGLMSSALWVAIATGLLVVLVLTIIVRSQYTNVFRNKRYWNKKIFEGNYGKIPTPSCADITNSIQNRVNSFEQDFQSGLDNASLGLQSGLNNAAQGLLSASKSVASVTSA